MRKQFRQEVFTIPNILSFIRLFMIPLMVWLYTVKEMYLLTLILVCISAVTDVIDGRIARKFNMTSDIGRVLDPVADKLTQFALIVCLSTEYDKMIYIAATLLIREMLMLLLGIIVATKKHILFNSRWFGKLATVVVYLSVIFLLIFRDMPETIVNSIMLLAETLILLSTVLYVIMFVSFIAGPNKHAEESICDKEQKK